MPRTRKTMKVGTTIKVLKRFIHPSAEIRAKDKNAKKDERLGNCMVVKKEEKKVNQRSQVCIVFRHD